ncbi:hypothetical protein [Akkermansia sp.]|uniref:hypothetical protein n=1 Tax=Akkermansia sp. TaxID=1872421 RepID=UPI0039946594
MSAFIVSQPALERNARILREVADAAGCRVVLALKGFSTWPCFEGLSPLLDGCCASGLWEALLARRRFGKHIDLSPHTLGGLRNWWRFPTTLISTA